MLIVVVIEHMFENLMRKKNLIQKFVCRLWRLFKKVPELKFRNEYIFSMSYTYCFCIKQYFLYIGDFKKKKKIISNFKYTFALSKVFEARIGFKMCTEIRTALEK